MSGLFASERIVELPRELDDGEREKVRASLAPLRARVHELVSPAEPPPPEKPREAWVITRAGATTVRMRVDHANDGRAWVFAGAVMPVFFITVLDMLGDARKPDDTISGAVVAVAFAAAVLTMGPLWVLRRARARAALARAAAEVAAIGA